MLVVATLVVATRGALGPVVCVNVSWPGGPTWEGLKH